MADLRIHANLAIAAGATFIPVCTACVALRVYARKRHGAGLGVDDGAVIAALIFVIAMGVTIITEVKLHRLGYAAPDPSTVVGKPNANYAFWPIEILQIPALGLVKASFVFLYKRIFTKEAAPIFNIIAWSMLGVITVWTLAFFFSIVFICGSDFPAYWTSTDVEALHCVKTSILHNALAISDVVTDVILIALPLPMIWRLHLTPIRKFGLCLVFGLGGLTIAASLVRMVIFIQATSENYDPNIDFEFLCTSGVYWSMIESGLGLCAACLPVMSGLTRIRDVQSLVKSVRSAISLRSLSSRSRGSDDQIGPDTGHPSSQTHIAGHAETPGENDHSLELGPMPQENEVVVVKELEQTRHPVGA